MKFIHGSKLEGSEDLVEATARAEKIFKEKFKERLIKTDVSAENLAMVNSELIVIDAGKKKNEPTIVFSPEELDVFKDCADMKQYKEKKVAPGEENTDSIRKNFGNLLRPNFQDSS